MQKKNFSFKMSDLNADELLPLTSRPFVDL
jgi:hypothetical protein